MRKNAADFGIQVSTDFVSERERDSGWCDHQLQLHLFGSERGDGEYADGHAGLGERSAVEEDDAGRVRESESGGDGTRFDHGLAGGYGVRGVCVLAAGEVEAGEPAVCSERDTGVDDLRV